MGRAGGHYYTYARTLSKTRVAEWYEYNDSYVSKMHAKAVRTPNAYVLPRFRFSTLLAAADCWDDCSCAGYDPGTTNDVAGQVHAFLPTQILDARGQRSNGVAELILVTWSLLINYHQYYRYLAARYMHSIRLHLLWAKLGNITSDSLCLLLIIAARPLLEAPVSMKPSLHVYCGSTCTM